MLEQLLSLSPCPAVGLVALLKEGLDVRGVDVEKRLPGLQVGDRWHKHASVFPASCHQHEAELPYGQQFDLCADPAAMVLGPVKFCSCYVD